MKVSVDKDTCVGCGLCPSICDEVFYMDTDGKANTKISDVSIDYEDDTKDAETSCPVNAITVV